jgi:hypothetical protein
VLTDIDPNKFKKNLAEKNVKVNVSLLRLNYYVLLHLKGVYNKQTKFYNIKLIDFNYEKNKKVKKHELSTKNFIEREEIGDIIVVKTGKISKEKMLVKSQSHVINNFDNLLLYKENCHKRYNNESIKTLVKKDRQKIMIHKMCKLVKVIKFLRMRILNSNNDKKISKFEKKIKKIQEQIDNERALAKMLGLRITVKEIWSKHKPRFFCLKMVDNLKVTSPPKRTITRESLLERIKNRDDLIVEGNKRTFKSIELTKKHYLFPMSIKHKKFGFNIEEEEYNLTALMKLETKVLGLVHTYKKDKKLSKTMGFSTFVSLEYNKIRSELS